MRNWIKKIAFVCMLSGLALFALPSTVSAKDADTIKAGVMAGDISLEGMSEEEAKAAIEEYVASLEEVEITLLAADDNEVVVTAGELGVYWSNTEIVEEAASLGSVGNVIQRYKARMDLQQENKVYPIELGFDIATLDSLLTEQCSKYDREAVDTSLVLKDGTFSVVEGQKGYLLDVEHSIDEVYNYLTTEWDHQACEIALVIAVTEPRGSAEELAQVKDLLGSFTTSFTSSNTSRSANVTNGSNLINGTTLYPGDEFSTYEAVSPFSESNGYYMAGSFLNGQVVDSIGGGICQVSTTLYNAVLLAELEVTMRYNHSMVVSYVDVSADAAIAESSGKDFKFVNNTDYPLYIESFVKDKKITFNIYGVETRPESRTITYISEILETTPPSEEVIYQNASLPVGYVDVTGAHVGYKARLWKVVSEGSVEVSREIVNTSSYKMSPRSAIVGTATDDPNAYNEIMAAIGTNSIDHIKAVAAMLTTPAQPETPAADAAPVQ